MVQVLVILAFFAARMQHVLGTPADTAQAVAPSWWGPTLPFVTLLVMWLAFHAFTRHAGAAIDRSGTLAPLGRAHALMATVRISVLLVLFACVLWPAMDWAGRVRSVMGDVVLLDEVVIASPVLLMLVLTWWSIEPLERRMHEATIFRSLASGVTLHQPESRRQWVWTQVRHQVLLVLVPICLVLAWSEAIDLLPRWFAIDPASWWMELLHLAGITLVLFLTPLLLRFIWSTEQLGDGALREQILATCRAYRVRIVGPLVWRTHGSLINAAILGVFFPFRYLLLTDALLERMPRDQLEVVLAHEVAHVRRRHMIWTAVAVFATVTGTALLIALAYQVLRLPTVLEPAVSLAAALVSVAAGFTVFGFISRRFEWDADAFAAAHLARVMSDGPAPVITDTAVASTVATLQSVADLNGMPVDRFSFRHGSIADRQKRVMQLLGLPVDRLPIARQVARIKLVALALLMLSLLPLIAGLWLERNTP